MLNTQNTQTVPMQVTQDQIVNPKPSANELYLLWLDCQQGKAQGVEPIEVWFDLMFEVLNGNVPTPFRVNPDLAIRFKTWEFPDPSAETILLV